MVVLEPTNSHQNPATTEKYVVEMLGDHSQM